MPQPIPNLERRICDEKYAREPGFARTPKLVALRVGPASPRMRVLDGGCGTGVNAALRSRGPIFFAAIRLARLGSGRVLWRRPAATGKST